MESKDKYKLYREARSKKIKSLSIDEQKILKLKNSNYQRTWRNKIENKNKIKEWQKNWKSNHKSKKNKKTISFRYSQYKYGAKIRKLNFTLTVEQFKIFWQKPCYYCGDEIETVGIDRVDNKIGYEFNNCVPCCKICNKLKGSMNNNEFIKHCIKISSKNLSKIKKL